MENARYQEAGQTKDRKMSYYKPADNKLAVYYAKQKTTIHPRNIPLLNPVLHWLKIEKRERVGEGGETKAEERNRRRKVQEKRKRRINDSPELMRKEHHKYKRVVTELSYD